ncbi:unnamed protein product [Darwinula stevensoni]|uniref:Uncharacterized protein n=1 Tax=Darwinula stevensoni TaxID=69355 RepID=A0A7R8XAN5_9CRUS|nr:unnamed protein product [Darwinula stevensoni]CAG0891550.1 unnamed protein product [Darwinula stevensoni]
MLTVPRARLSPGPVPSVAMVNTCHQTGITCGVERRQLPVVMVHHCEVEGERKREKPPVPPKPSWLVHQVTMAKGQHVPRRHHHHHHHHHHRQRGNTTPRRLAALWPCQQNLLHFQFLSPCPSRVEGSRDSPPSPLFLCVEALSVVRHEVEDEIASVGSSQVGRMNSLHLSTPESEKGGETGEAEKEKDKEAEEPAPPEQEPQRESRKKVFSGIRKRASSAPAAKSSKESSLPHIPIKSILKSAKQRVEKSKFSASAHELASSLSGFVKSHSSHGTTEKKSKSHVPRRFRKSAERSEPSSSAKSSATDVSSQKSISSIKESPLRRKPEGLPKPAPRRKVPVGTRYCRIQRDVPFVEDGATTVSDSSTEAFREEDTHIKYEQADAELRKFIHETLMSNGFPKDRKTEELGREIEGIVKEVFSDPSVSECLVACPPEFGLEETFIDRETFIDSLVQNIMTSSQYEAIGEMSWQRGNSPAFPPNPRGSPDTLPRQKNRPTKPPRAPKKPLVRSLSRELGLAIEHRRMIEERIYKENVEWQRKAMLETAKWMEERQRRQEKAERYKELKQMLEKEEREKQAKRAKEYADTLLKSQTQPKRFQSLPRDQKFEFNSGTLTPRRRRKKERIPVQPATIARDYRVQSEIEKYHTPPESPTKHFIRNVGRSPSPSRSQKRSQSSTLHSRKFQDSPSKPERKKRSQSFHEMDWLKKQEASSCARMATSEPDMDLAEQSMYHKYEKISRPLPNPPKPPRGKGKEDGNITPATPMSDTEALYKTITRQKQNYNHDGNFNKSQEMVGTESLGQASKTQLNELSRSLLEAAKASLIEQGIPPSKLQSFELYFANILSLPELKVSKLTIQELCAETINVSEITAEKIHKHVSGKKEDERSTATATPSTTTTSHQQARRDGDQTLTEDLTGATYETAVELDSDIEGSLKSVEVAFDTIEGSLSYIHSKVQSNESLASPDTRAYHQSLKHEGQESDVASTDHQIDGFILQDEDSVTRSSECMEDIPARLDDIRLALERLLAPRGCESSDIAQEELWISPFGNEVVSSACQVDAQLLEEELQVIFGDLAKKKAHNNMSFTLGSFSRSVGVSLQPPQLGGSLLDGRSYSETSHFQSSAQIEQGLELGRGRDQVGDREFQDSEMCGEVEEPERPLSPKGPAMSVVVSCESEDRCLANGFNNDPDSTSFSSEAFPNLISNCEETDSEDLDPGTRRKQKSFFIVQEIVSSEKGFVDVLKLLTIDFAEFVAERCDDNQTTVIPQAEIKRVFNHLPQLYQLNSDLLSDLSDRLANWHIRPQLADIFVKKGPFLKLYATYCQDYEAQCALLDEYCAKYPQWKKHVEDFEALDRCQRLKLQHYMLKPIQRVPQYRLLLDKYFRCLDPEEMDYEPTKSALLVMCDVADHINNSMKVDEAFNQLWQLQNQLQNFEVIQPGRRILKKGELLKICRKGTQARYFILMTDILLHTSYVNPGTNLPTGNGLYLRNAFQLTRMKVALPKIGEYQHEFSIISSTRSFSLVARSSAERVEWVQALQAAIDENASRRSTFCAANPLIYPTIENHTDSDLHLGKEAPVWVPDSRVTMCQLCTSEFTVTFRRHHCRACGKVVCSSCSNNEAPLEYLKNKCARVCDYCYVQLKKNFNSRKDSPQTSKSSVSSAESEADMRDSPDQESCKGQFKKFGSSATRRSQRSIPQRLREVRANTEEANMSGYLYQKKRANWRKLWFVLKDKVLYAYGASEDISALESLPLLGYHIRVVSEESPRNHFEGIDASLVFYVSHPNQQPLFFHTDSPDGTNRWVKALREATVLDPS